MAEIISLTELIETRLKKQQEIEYYQESLERLQKKIGELGKEVVGYTCLKSWYWMMFSCDQLHQGQPMSNSDCRT